MAWSRKLPVSIRLRDGRRIITLEHARSIMLTLPERYDVMPFWQYAAELLIDAAEQGGDVQEAWAQLSRALEAEGCSEGVPAKMPRCRRKGR
jgi:hypothetical protein